MNDDIQFEVGKAYRNRMGQYTVLKISGDEMQVRYDTDGLQQTLMMDMQKRIFKNMLREGDDIPQIAVDRDTFFTYIDKCAEHFHEGHDLNIYREIITLHRQTNSLEHLLEDDNFYSLIRRTLQAWNMDQKGRGAILTSLLKMKVSILKCRQHLLELYQYRMETLSINQIDRLIKKLLWEVFSGLSVMESERKIVGVSKALHFLLPDLVMPIDSPRTMMFFYGYNRYSSDPKNEFRTLMDVFMKAHSITQRLSLTKNDISGEGWNTSIPKLIDNAIIGFFK